MDKPTLFQKLKYAIYKNRDKPLPDRVTHLENQVLRELGDIGDIAKRFLDLKDDMEKRLEKQDDIIVTLKKRIKKLEGDNK